MFNEDKLARIITDYKANIAAAHGIYKWKAVKCFQDNWDIDATDFPGMLEKSLAKTSNLLTSKMYNPRGVITEMARKDPDVVKNAFSALFDERIDLSGRIRGFMNVSDQLRGPSKPHHQGVHSISGYLTLRYPEKYYFYKFMLYKEFAQAIDLTDNIPADKIGRVIKYFDLCDAILSVILRDKELCDMSRARLGPDDYRDESYHLLTQDIIYYGCHAGHPPVVPPKVDPSKSRSRDDFLAEVYLDPEDYTRLSDLLLSKKNVILQGPPGTGKTFAARRLAYSFLGTKDADKVAFVQFHQSYSYEDFIMGYKPRDNGFALKNGVFYKFCLQAKNNPREKFFFIIDEINRGNISKIFGETLMAIENNHRGETLTLAYEDTPFTVPENVYIIGMMNTADRSLAQMDYALRRRFSFFTMYPAFDNERFKQYQKSLGSVIFDDLIKIVKDLNKAITKDPSLGEGCCIGHSYFCDAETRAADELDGWLRSVVEFDIIPLLSEYWFEDREKQEEWTKRLRDVFNE